MSKLKCHFKGQIKEVYIYPKLTTFKRKILNDFNEDLDKIDYLNLNACDNSFSTKFQIENQSDYESIIFDLNINNIICDLNEYIKVENNELNQQVMELKIIISKLKKDIYFCKNKYNKEYNKYISLKRDIDEYKIKKKKKIDYFIKLKKKNNYNIDIYKKEQSINIINFQDKENNMKENIENESRFSNNKTKLFPQENDYNSFNILNISENNIEYNSSINQNKGNKKNDSDKEEDSKNDNSNKNEINSNEFEYINNDKNENNINEINENENINNEKKDNNDNFDNENEDENYISIIDSNSKINNSIQSEELYSSFIIFNNNPIYKNKNEIINKTPIKIEIKVKNNGKNPIPRTDIICDQESDLYIFETLVNNGNDILPNEEINVKLNVFFKDYQNIKNGLNTIFIYLKKEDNTIIGKKKKIEIMIKDNMIERQDNIESNSESIDNISENDSFS